MTRRVSKDEQSSSAEGSSPSAEETQNDLECGPANAEDKGGEALWVLGGATTVAADGASPLAKQQEMQKVAHGAPAADDTAGPPAEMMPHAFPEPGVFPLGKDAAALRAGSHLRVAAKDFRGRLRGCSAGCQEMWQIVRLYPLTILIPVVVFLLLCGLGVWGVIAGAASLANQRRDEARSRALDSVTGFQIQLQQTFTPGVTFSMLVRQRPDWDYWLENFNSTAAELLSRVPDGALYNLQLQPLALVMMIHPMRDNDISQVIPPRDLLNDTARRDDILQIIKTKEPLIVGPFPLVSGFIGAFVRYPIYVPHCNWNDTFGFRYRENTSAIPYAQLPQSARDCVASGMCYNNVTREKWWGLLTMTINYDAVTKGRDAYLANLRKMNFDYALVRRSGNTEQVIAQVGRTDLRDTDAVTVEVSVVNTKWYLRVAPRSGFQPSWRAPLVAAVVVIALIISALLFVSLVSYKRQRLLLHETVAANLSLAETTKQLQEEKVRMDVLLARQYELLRCLDSNRDGRKSDVGSSDVGSSDPYGNSKKAMMARIEDARRSLNVAKATQEDPIQIFELLGAGAFGKVQKGLWRGTVVAVKTMILPANMTGQQKREKMAVMEAAISSSLVHPNIVTTYTYFIRPYHEPHNERIKHMVTSGSGSVPPVPTSGETDDGSSSGESTIHSYEVRLVLEFCDKGSLKDALDQHAFMQGGALNMAAILETAADIAKAMVHMHAASVLHSDLKARNIMLKSSGTEGRGVVAKVADFGLSTRMEHAETHLSSCFQGTLTHMAPEVMLEGRISKAADVYSFGIVLWELFCASDPFAGVPRAHLGHAITKECKRPVFPPFAPRDYVALAQRCWDPDAAARPSFEEVLTELVRIREELGGDTPPLIITPPPPLDPNAVSSRGRGFIAAGSSSAAFNGHGDFGTMGRDTLLGAGVVLGGASTVAGGSGTAPGVVLAPGSGGFGALGPLSMQGLSAGSRSSIKAALAARHLRKMGLRLGQGSGGLTLQRSLPSLLEHNEEGEGRGRDGDGDSDKGDSRPGSKERPREGV